MENLQIWKFTRMEIVLTSIGHPRVELLQLDLTIFLNEKLFERSLICSFTTNSSRSSRIIENSIQNNCINEKICGLPHPSRTAPRSREGREGTIRLPRCELLPEERSLLRTTNRKHLTNISHFHQIKSSYRLCKKWFFSNKRFFFSETQRNVLETCGSLTSASPTPLCLSFWIKVLIS